MRVTRLSSAFVVLGILVGLDGRVRGQDSADAVARRQYEVGVRHLDEGKYEEGMRDLERVVKESPKSPAAADALFAIARYQLLVLRQPDLATATINDLNQRFTGSAAAASAQVLRGQIPLARRRDAKDIEQAVAEFLRVPALYPDRPEAQQQALYYAGETLRMGAEWTRAQQQYKALLRRFPRSGLAGAALIGAGQCSTALGRPYEAMQEFQRARDLLPDNREAARALDLNTLIYRLYVPGASPFALATTASAVPKVDDVEALRVDPEGRLILVHKQGAVVTALDGKSSRQIPAKDARGVAFNFGRPVVVTEKGLVPEGSGMVVFHSPKAGEQARPLENIEDAVVTSIGEVLVADRGVKAIARFSLDGTMLGPFASVQANKLAIADTTDQVAVLDTSSKSVKLYARDGRLLGAVTGGQGAAFERPVALAYDVLGHLYVLDAGRASVDIFAVSRAPVRSFSVPEKAAGSFKRGRAIAVDGAGRLFIFDERNGLLVFE